MEKINIKINYNNRKIYIGRKEEFGRVQFEVFPKIREAVKMFKSKNINKILDLGCGLGVNSIYLAQKGFQICAADICEKYTNIVENKAEKVELKNIECMIFDMKELPFNDKSFDGIICISTLSHGTFDDIRNYINEIYRVLKLKGMLITDILSIEDDSFGIGEQIEKNTFIGGRDGEENIPHHYTNEEEMRELFSRFSEVVVNKSEYIFDLGKDKEFVSKVFDIKAIK